MTEFKTLKDSKVVRMFEPASLLLQEDDVLVSKKGMVCETATGRYKIFHRVKFCGNGKWIILGNKQAYVELEPIKKEGGRT